MNRWKLLVPVVACMAAVSMTGCHAEVVAQPVAPAPAPGPAPAPAGDAVVEAEGPPAAVQVQVAPPAEQVEVVPVAPTGNYIWVKGHWRWVPAHYENRGGVWIFIGPHWAR
jgi:hypothetical protein